MEKFAHRAIAYTFSRTHTHPSRPHNSSIIVHQKVSLKIIGSFVVNESPKIVTFNDHKNHKKKQHTQCKKTKKKSGFPISVFLSFSQMQFITIVFIWVHQV